MSYKQRLLFSLTFSLLSLSTYAQMPCQSHYFGRYQSCQLQQVAQDMRTRVKPPTNMASRAGCATFDINFSGIAQNVQDAFSYAADIWSSQLASDVPIKVHLVYFLPAGSALGVGIANATKDFPGAPQADTWYPSALANAIAGVDLQPGEDDMTIYMSNTTNWYFGTDGNTPAGMTDFVSVALHELGHGLGFTSIVKVAGGQGSIGRITSSDFPPTTFPFPMLAGEPGVFDRFIFHNGSGFFITNDTVFPNPSQALAGVLTGGDLFLNAPIARMSHNGLLPKLYVPSVFALGSSVTHLDDATFPAGDTNSLMSHSIGQAEAIHSPGPIVMGLFQDLGWPLCEAVGIEEEITLSHISTGPNPMQEAWNVSFSLTKPAEVRLEIFGINGQLVQIIEANNLIAGAHTVSWDGKMNGQKELPSGLYVYQLKINEARVSGKILKE